MVTKIADIETIITPTEKEALILENNLIKKYRPRFNVTYRDDKNYPYLRLSLDEPYPTLTIVRQPKKDGSQYFGPFASARAVRETLKLIHLVFPLRKCHGKRLEKKRPCIYHQLGQCPAPCCCLVDIEEYRTTVRDVQLFLQGRSREIIDSLQKKMELESQALNFEHAARTRDRINALQRTLEKQAMVSLDFVDRDVFSYYREGAHMELVVLFIRCGRMSGSRNFSLHNLQLADAEVLSSFLAQYYFEGKFIPREVIVPVQPPDKALLVGWLTEKKGEPVKIISPALGPNRSLVEMATHNAKILFDRHHAGALSAEDLLSALQKKLGLKDVPVRIAGVDISNIMGTAAVGSVVVFENGQPNKELYRRFRVKTVTQADDYAMMYEVVTRYLTRARAEHMLPELIMADGGKGQLGEVLTALQDTGIATVQAISLAKVREVSRTAGADQHETDRIFLPSRKQPLILVPRSPVLMLLQRIRDEAHRFAITYHKNLKSRQDLTSSLEGLPSIGKKTAQRILTHFGGLENVRSTSLKNLAEVNFLNKKQAAAIYFFFHPDETPATYAKP
jgi:excinuclease ABC subunit C